jgi:pyruvate dehydrogenase E2 component (dihydrolipoamide acetyltransferase)
MTEFRMPSLGADMEEGTILEWRVAPGAEVHKGDLVALVETEKSDLEIEVFESGVIGELLVPVGQTVAVGTPLATILPAGAPAVAAGPSDVSGRAATESVAKRPAQKAGPAVEHVTSPVVRHLAERLHVGADHLVGTGPGGRVTREDVEHAAHPAAEVVRRAPAASSSRPRVSPRARRMAAVGQAPAPSPVATPAPPPAAAPAPPVGDRNAAMRRAIGRAMARSKREIPHYYLSQPIELSEPLRWLEELNADRSVGERVLPAALLLRATALAAREVGSMNGLFLDEQFRAGDGVHLAVAISLRGGGLVAPAIHDADRKSLPDLMAALKDLVLRARAGRLSAVEVSEGTLTVTNLGDRGVAQVFPVITPPQVATVGFGRVMDQPWAVDGLLGVRPVVWASLAGDHRVSDGHDGARFLDALAAAAHDRTALAFEPLCSATNSVVDSDGSTTEGGAP